MKENSKFQRLFQKMLFLKEKNSRGKLNSRDKFDFPQLLLLIAKCADS